MNTIPVVVFEDNKALSDSLCLLVNRSKKYEVKAAYVNCKEAATATFEHAPKVVLMDIDMPEVNGIQSLKRIKEISPATYVKMLTVFINNDHVFNAVRAGADGYLLKKSKPAQITSAIDEVLEGGAPMTPSIAKNVLSFFSAKEKEQPKENQLTPKETEVLKALAEGFSYKMIAEELGVAIETVRSHIKKIYRKLKVNSAS